MLVYECKLDASDAQYANIDNAIRVAQFVRNKCLRLWMDGYGIGANDLQVACSQLAEAFPFAARLNSQARQAAASRAWQAISRFYDNCRRKKPGKKGYPKFRHHSRSVEYKQTGWMLDPDGKHLTFTDACGIGRVRLVGTRDVSTFPLSQIQRVRLVRRADGYYAQFVIKADRNVTHIPTGKAVGIDVGLKAYYTDSNGHAVANPRFLRRSERKLGLLNRRLSRKSVRHRKGSKPKHNHCARHRARHNKYPAAAQLQVRVLSPQPQSPTYTQAHSQQPQQQPHPSKQSANWHKARIRLARKHLTVQRQREDFARKQANALVSSHDLIALEDLQVRNLVKNRYLAKSISDAGWARFRHWVEYYGGVHGIPIIAVPPQYTSQRCSQCGTLVKKTLSVRTHVCPSCSVMLDRDHNAARMILVAALIQDGHDRTAGHAGT